jgi:hypothetical protein
MPSLANAVCNSDVRGNLDRQIGRWICFGDAVGYGADPVACLQCVEKLSAVVLHDTAVAGDLSDEYFNRYTCETTKLTPSNSFGALTMLLLPGRRSLLPACLASWPNDSARAVDPSNL